MASIEGHVSRCTACRELVWAWHHALLQLSAEMPEASPPIELRQRVLDSCGGANRFLPFADRVAELFDVAPAVARQQLARFDSPKAWQSALAGVAYLDVEGGPGLAPLHAGLVRMSVGAVFPRHRHCAEERYLILRGQVADSRGTTFGPGDFVVNAAGTEHSIAVEGDEDLLYAVVLGGFELVFEPTGSSSTR